MTREQAVKWVKFVYDVLYEDKDEEIREALNMAIEALSKPNYETDTEVRLAVMNRKKEKVILWDAFEELEYYPIEALKADVVSRDLYDKRTQADEEIIDSYRQEFQKALSADAVQGEWIHDGQNFKGGLDWCHCSVCGYKTSTNGISIYRYCPNCGARMKGGDNE